MFRFLESRATRITAITLTLLGFSSIGSVVEGRDWDGAGPRLVRADATTGLVCSLSAFFSVDAKERVQTSNRKVSLEGRGLISCENDHGFSTEVPVFADLEAQLPEMQSPGADFSFSGNTSPFVIPREINQIHDTYSPRAYSWLREPQAVSHSTVLFRGANNDLVMEMTLNSQSLKVTDIKVKSLRLRFDDQAPDLH